MLALLPGVAEQPGRRNLVAAARGATRALGLCRTSPLPTGGQRKPPGQLPGIQLCRTETDVPGGSDGKHSRPRPPADSVHADVRAERSLVQPHRIPVQQDVQARDGEQ